MSNELARFPVTDSDSFQTFGKISYYETQAETDSVNFVGLVAYCIACWVYLDNIIKFSLRIKWHFSGIVIFDPPCRKVKGHLDQGNSFNNMSKLSSQYSDIRMPFVCSINMETLCSPELHRHVKGAFMLTRCLILITPISGLSYTVTSIQ